jgi:hypothetical protein
MKVASIAMLIGLDNGRSRVVGLTRKIRALCYFVCSGMTLVGGEMKSFFLSWGRTPNPTQKSGGLILTITTSVQCERLHVTRRQRRQPLPALHDDAHPINSRETYQ